MRPRSGDKLAGNAPEASQTRPSGPWGSFGLAILALLGAIECAAVGANLLRPFVPIDDHRPVMLAAGAATGLAGGVALFVFLSHLLGRRKPPGLFRAGAAVLVILVAVQMGVLATLIAFGVAGPWGFIVDGISGPLFGWSGMVPPPGWWPVPFVFGFIGTVGVIGHLWNDARAKGFITAEGTRA